MLAASYDAAFFLRSTPVSQVQAIAAAGVNMPPKSTFFYPKVPTGLCSTRCYNAADNLSKHFPIEAAT